MRQRLLKLNHSTWQSAQVWGRYLRDSVTDGRFLKNTFKYCTHVSALTTLTMDMARGFEGQLCHCPNKAAVLVMHTLVVRSYGHEIGICSCLLYPSPWQQMWACSG